MPRLFSSLFSGLVFVSLLTLSQTSLARTYKVELVVFAYLADTANEQWDFASQSVADQLAQHHQSKARSRNINNPRALSNLAGIRSRIANSGRYQILKTLSWTQSSASYANSPLIEVDSPGNQLDGTVRVYAPNLLFSEFNLRYYPGSIAPPPVAAYEYEQYFLQEKRRLKLKEVHYFDHPKFGAILSVRPIAAAPATAPTTATAQ